MNIGFFRKMGRCITNIAHRGETTGILTSASLHFLRPGSSVRLKRNTLRTDFCYHRIGYDVAHMHYPAADDCGRFVVAIGDALDVYLSWLLDVIPGHGRF